MYSLTALLDEVEEEAWMKGNEVQNTMIILERDEARAEVKKYHDALVARHGGEPVVLLQELDEARAEVEEMHKRMYQSHPYYYDEWKKTTAEVERLRAELDRPRYETLRQLADAVERNEHLKAEVERLRDQVENLLHRMTSEEAAAEVERLRKQLDACNASAAVTERQLASHVAAIKALIEAGDRLVGLGPYRDAGDLDGWAEAKRKAGMRVADALVAHGITVAPDRSEIDRLTGKRIAPEPEEGIE
ncbi:MAG: hypothetical protein MUF10_20705 [Thermoanaerobaculaceae bacterium]|nr:hypothetical protein [Thermoanaerobaculaceae bacterium]